MIKQDNRVEKTKSRKKCTNALAEGFSEYKEGYLLLTEPHTETRYFVYEPSGTHFTSFINVYKSFYYKSNKSAD